MPAIDGESIGGAMGRLLVILGFEPDADGQVRPRAAVPPVPAEPAAAVNALPDLSNQRSRRVADASRLAGVPTWFLDRTRRTAEVTRNVEECTALAAIARGTPGANKSIPGVKKLASDLDKLPNAFTDCNDRATAGPDDAVIEAYATFEAKAKLRKEIGETLRDLYSAAKSERLAKEPAAEKGFTASVSTAVGGQGRMFDMAHFAEHFCARHRPDRNGPVTPFDPYKNDPPMLVAEVAAVYGYSTQDYVKVNARMRKRAEQPAASSTLEDDETDVYATACRTGLSKLPVFKGTVTRCDKTLPPHLVAELIASGTRTEPAFFSTAAGAKGVPGFGNITSYIEDVKTGREISMFSMHQEGEVLFPPGARFAFVRMEAGGLKNVTQQEIAAALGDDIVQGRIPCTLWFREI